MITSVAGRVPSSAEDAAAVEAVKRHHEALAAGIAGRVEALLAASESGAADVEVARRELLRFCETELVPHALAEEATLYAAGSASPDLELLVVGMIEEHGSIKALLAEVSGAASPTRAAAAARALLALFQVHLVKENDLLLPVLAASPDVSVARLLGQMHEHLG